MVAVPLFFSLLFPPALPFLSYFVSPPSATSPPNPCSRLWLPPPSSWFLRLVAFASILPLHSLRRQRYCTNTSSHSTFAHGDEFFQLEVYCEKEGVALLRLRQMPV